MVKVFSFGAEHGRHTQSYGSNFLMSRMAHTEGIYIGCMRLGQDGLVGYHLASTYQLFAVVEGEGWVRGAGLERVPIRAGQATLWEPGEGHQAETDTGMVAIVVESDTLGGNPEAIGPVPRQL